MLFEGVSTVTSLTNIIDIKSTEEGIEVGKLVDEYNLPQTQDELDSLKKYVLSKDLYKGSIVSEDGTFNCHRFYFVSGCRQQECC
ncbi:MAG: hypothetical protein MZV70_36660 [Desulfobacterales bacterium]|nr:hypothetical protein [Desulfobacterales bacterium]